MATTAFDGNAVATCGELPSVDAAAPAFTLVKQDLSEVTLESLSGKKVVLNVFPSIDTPVCALSVKKFNQEAAQLNNTVVLCVSMDLPFAAARFCGAEGIENVMTASAFRSPEFGSAYGLSLAEGPLKGLLARAVIVIDEDGKVSYVQLVPEIKDEPDYASALQAVKG